MSSLVRMSAKGQLVVPQYVREELDLKPGDAFIGINTPEGVLFKKIYDGKEMSEEFRKLSEKISARFKKDKIQPKDIKKEILWARKSLSTRTSSSPRSAGKARRTKQ